MRYEWKECSLGDLITFQRGYDLPKTKMQGGIYPVVGSNGIIGYHNEYTTESPSITVGRSGNVGKPFIYKGKSWSHNTSLYIKEFKNVDPIFIYYYLQILDLGNYAGGSAVPTLNRNHIHSLNVYIPAKIDTQKKIAMILGSLDDKITLNQQINKNLEAQAQAIFDELFANVTYNTTLSELGTVVGGSTPSKKHPEYYTEKGIAWITPKDLSNDSSKFIYHGENDITELGLSKCSASLMPAGTVLFSSRAPIGYTAIAANSVTTNQGFKSVIPKKEIGTAFVYYFLKNNLNVIESMASGSTFKEISAGAMKIVPAFMPDAGKLKKFREFCNPVFKYQQSLERENVRLAAIRDALLPRLMSGEIDVSGIEI